MARQVIRRAREIYTHKLKLSTLHEISILKITQACISLDDFCVSNVCFGCAGHNLLTVRAKKLAQDNPVHASSH